jgi:hydroxymethylpyrimidine/phosphomethylpyrimidine kinase
VIAVGGSDPTCGAGVQADLRTLEAFGVLPATVITAVTVQDGRRVLRVELLPAALVTEQLRAAVASFTIGAVKCGMLARPSTVRALAAELALLAAPLVLDPVVRAGGGESIGGDDTLRAIVRHLFPLAAVVTCNVLEAEAVTGRRVASVEEAERAARMIGGLGPAAVVVKGGHLTGDPIDVVWDGKRIRRLTGPRISGAGMHGTGCAFASAVAAGLALGHTTTASVTAARNHVRRLIADSVRARSGAVLRRSGRASR